MSNNEVITRIREVAERVLPEDSKLYLYGSRARGDNREDSDWDLLVLLNKQRIEPNDYDKYSYPFAILGWDINQYINPILYTTNNWETKSFTPFYKNVMSDRIVL